MQKNLLASDYDRVCCNRPMILPKTIRTAIKIQSKEQKKARISWTSLWRRALAEEKHG